MTNDEIMALTPEQLRVEIAKAKGWNVREKVYRRREEGYSHDTEIKELVYGAWPDCFTLPN